MIKEIFKPKLAEILPKSIREDKEIYALAKSIDSELEKIISQAKNVLHLPRLDELPTEILDHLAWQYHCDFYQQDLPDSAKRNQIRETIFWHRIKGTPAGVEKAISTFMQGAKVQENWEYGGKPFFFRIITKGLKYLTTEEEILRLIFLAKNVRSWLEEIIYDLTIEEPEIYHVAIGETEAGIETTLIGFNEKDLANHNLFQAVAELAAGMEITKFGTGFEERHKKFVGILELQAGYQLTDLQEKPPKDEEYAWERYIAQKWREWNLNPVVNIYVHPDEGEIFPDDDEPFPIGGNFLRLYFKFPDNRIRYLTLYNPKDNLTSADIKVAGLLSRGNLINSRGKLATGIARALYINREEFKVL